MANKVSRDLAGETICVARTEKEICSCPADTTTLKAWTRRGYIRDWSAGNVDPDVDLFPFDVPDGLPFEDKSDLNTLNVLLVFGELLAMGAWAGLKKVIGAASRPRRKRFPSCIGTFDELRTITANNNGLESLDNIDRVKHLKNLHVPDNRVKKIIPLPVSTQLIDLSDNKVKKMENLDGLENLKELYLDGNKIKKIEGLDGLDRLTSLRLGENKISRVEGLDDLENLQYLYLNDNKITKVENLEHLDSVEDIYLFGNKIDPGDLESIIKELAKMDDIRHASIFNEIKERGNYFTHPAQFQIDTWLDQRRVYKGIPPAGMAPPETKQATVPATR